MKPENENTNSQVEQELKDFEQKMEQVYESRKKDPNYKEPNLNPMFKLCDDLLQTVASSQIVKNPNVEDWELQLIMALGKATCSIIAALNHSCVKPGVDLFPYYKDVVLPASMLAVRQIQHMSKEMEQEAKEHDKNLN